MIGINTGDAGEKDRERNEREKEREKIVRVSSCFFHGHLEREDKQRMLHKRAEIRRIIPFKREVSPRFSITWCAIKWPIGTPWRILCWSWKVKNSILSCVSFRVNATSVVVTKYRNVDAPRTLNLKMMNDRPRRCCVRSPSPLVSCCTALDVSQAFGSKK